MSLKHIDLIYEQRFNSHWSDRLHSKKKYIKDLRGLGYIYNDVSWILTFYDENLVNLELVLSSFENLVKWWIVTDFQWWNSKRVIWGFRIERKQDWVHQIEWMEEGSASDVSDVKRGGYIYIWTRYYSWKSTKS
jgi:hypothetical protein